MKVIEYRSKMNFSPQQLFNFHNQPEALKVLTPFPVIIQVVEDKREDLREGIIHLRMWMGFLPITWIAEHAPGSIELSFKDIMRKGPMAHWEHEHIFEEAEDGAILIDRITLKHKKGLMQLFTRFAFDGIMLRLLFWYRHYKTKRCVKLRASKKL